MSLVSTHLPPRPSLTSGAPRHQSSHSRRDVAPATERRRNGRGECTMKEDARTRRWGYGEAASTECKSQREYARGVGRQVCPSAKASPEPRIDVSPMTRRTPFRSVPTSAIATTGVRGGQDGTWGQFSRNWSHPTRRTCLLLRPVGLARRCGLGKDGRSRRRILGIDLRHGVHGGEGMPA